MSLPAVPPPDPEGIGNPALIGRLTRLHDPPWETTKDAIGALNPEWWAGLYVVEHHLLYEEDAGFFAYDDLSGLYERRTPYRIQTELSRRLLRASRKPGLARLASKRSLPFLRQCVELMRGLADALDPFAARRPLVALANGVLILDRGKIVFREFSPTFHLRSKAAVPFDAAARCPRFEQEFIGGMMDPDDADLLSRYLGCLLFGMNPCHRMAILDGQSAAGKTSLINIMVALVGADRAIQVRTKHLENEFELDAYRDRTLLIAGDVGEDFLIEHGAQTLKGLCTSDIFHPEGKGRRERRTLQGPFGVLVGTNCELTYRDQKDGPAWRRRLLILKCSIPEGRRRIADFDRLLLKTEGAGIVNWLVAGAVRALKETEHAGDLSLTPEQQDRIDSLVMRSDSVRVFVEFALALDDANDVTVEEAEEGYAVFCASRNWKPLTGRKFYAQLAEKIFHRFGRTRSNSLTRDGKEQRGWRGLRLLDSGWRAN